MNDTPLPPFIPSANPKYIIPLLGAIVIFILLKVYQNWYDSKSKTKKTKQAQPFSSLKKDLKQIFSMYNFSESQKVFFKNLCTEYKITNPLLFIHDESKIESTFSRKLHQLDTLASDNPDLEKDKTILFTIQEALIKKIKNKSPYVTTRSIPLDQEITLITSTDEHYKSVILSNTQDGLVCVLPRDISENELRLQQYAKIEVFFSVVQFNQSYRFQTKLLEYITDSNTTRMLLSHSNSLQVLALRKHERKTLELQCTISLVKIANIVNGKETKHKYFPLRESFKGLITDISLGGCTIITSKMIPTNTYIQITTSIDSLNEDRMIGRIVRLSQENSNSIMHISFVQMPRISLNRVFSLFFT